VSSTDTSGEWREERLYVLKSLEELKAEQRRQIEAEAILHHTTAIKAQKDIRAAHDKIRVLEDSGKTAQIKNWILTTALSCAVAVLFEIVKAYLHK
jgi:hypothetical protein